MVKNAPSTADASSNRTLELAGPVSDRVQIRHVLLAESLARRASHAAKPSQLRLHVNVRTEPNQNEQLIEVFPRFTLTGRTESAEEILRIEALLVVAYQVPTFDGLEKANFDAFGEMNGIYNAWPYWREFVQSMTVRMGLPALTIPVYRPLANKTPPKEDLSATTPRE